MYSHIVYLTTRIGRKQKLQQYMTTTENITKLLWIKKQQQLQTNKQNGGKYEKTHIFISIERIKQIKLSS